MARGRKKVVVEKDFDKLIADAEKRIDDAKHKRLLFLNRKR